MSDTELSLTPAEQSYFDSGGQTVPAASPEPAAAPPDTPTGVGAEEGAAAGTQPPEKPPTMVPHAALHEERERRKELQRQIEENNRWRQSAEARLQQMAAAWQAQQPPPPQAPTWDESPVDAARYGLEQTQQQVQAVAQTVQQLAAQRQAEEAMARMNHWAASQEQQFVAKAPDYSDAVQFLTQRRTDTYRAMGAPDDQIPALLEQERVKFLAHAAQQGLDVPATVYQLAKSMGYTAKQAQAAAGAARIDQLQAGQQAAVSVGSMPGKPAQGLTLESLAQMPDDEFEAFLAKNPKAWKQMMNR